MSINETNLRQIAADRIKSQRNKDRDPFMSETRSRGLLKYVSDMGGVQYFLEYLNSLKATKDFPQPYLLDIGAGNGEADIELQQYLKQWLGDLNIKVSSLKRSPNLPSYFSKNNIHITSAETLRGIKENSIAGIYSNFGLGHSAAPELSIQAVNRVLVPSGCVKFTYADVTNPQPNSTEYKSRQTHQKFIQELSVLNYSIATRTYSGNSFESKRPIIVTILLAIKPPFTSIDAGTLLQKDWENKDQQIDYIYKNIPGYFSNTDLVFDE